MNWNQELVTSAIWLVKAYSMTLILSVIIVWGLSRFTLWGRQFWLLAGPYFSPKNSWKPLIGLAVIIFIALCAVRLDVLFSNWYNGMYTAMQKLDAKAFWQFMVVFSVLAAIHIVRALSSYYLQQRFTIYWRTWLNDKLLSHWTEQKSYYYSQYLSSPIDNPDQRLQQDIASFTTSSLSLFTGVISALVSIVAFTLILWNLSGILPIFGLEIPRGMVFIVFAYVIIVTGLAFKIGKPLIRLNFLNEKLNADYRYALIRLREHAESIAFYCGEKIENQLLKSRFGMVISNNWNMVYRALKFQGFNFITSQVAVVFPFIIQAPRFFSKQITLGDMIQTAQAFGNLQDNLSFFRNAYDEFASYRAMLERLHGFTLALEQSDQLPKPVIQTNEQQLSLHQLTVYTPTRQQLINKLELDLTPGQSLLIQGPSGSGKTTLLRSLAGLWPYTDGSISRPVDNVIFLSQKPYLPLGSLRNALYYPAQPPADNQAAQAMLEDIQLGHLIGSLDEERDWSHILSLGEQQRLAFGRLLLAQPTLAFLDEATSAMDEGLEDSMYRQIRQRLPQAMLVSVGHRSTLQRHHTLRLELQTQGNWAVQPL